MKRGQHLSGDLDVVALQNLQRILTGGGIGHSGPTGNDRGIIAGHITDGQSNHLGRRTSSGQTSAFDARQVFSDAIHFANVGAAFEQRLIDGLLFGQAQTLGGQRQQGGAATRYEAQNQIVLGQTLGQLQNFFGGCQTRRIGHRV